MRCVKQLTQCLAHSQHCEGFSDYSRTWLKKKKASSLAPVSGDLDSGLCVFHNFPQMIHLANQVGSPMDASYLRPVELSLFSRTKY